MVKKAQVVIEGIVDLQVDQRAVNRVNKNIQQAVGAFTSGNIKEATKDLKKLSATYSRMSEAIGKGADNFKAGVTAKGGKLTKATTLNSLLPTGEITKELSAFRRLKGPVLEEVASLYQGLSDITKTATFATGSQLGRGEELFRKSMGLDSVKLQKLLADPKDQKALATYRSYIKETQGRFEAVRKQLFRTLKPSDLEGGKQYAQAFSTSFPELTSANKAFNDQLRQIDKLGDAAARIDKANKQSLKDVERAAKSKDKLLEAAKQRLLRQEGYRSLKGSIGNIASIPKADIPAAQAALASSQEVASRAQEQARAKASKGDKVAAARLRELNSVQKELNKALRTGTARMGGFHSASAQAAATLRQFFKYALGYGALYQVLGAVTALVRGLVDLDAALVSIRAIAGATADDMDVVEASIKRVAVTTKFNIAEIAQAAQVLSQAGVEPGELSSALESVALFASASNTTLATSADVISTMRNVFTDLTDGQIADQLTKAVNISKLTGDDLKTILSRGTQVAKAYNITSEQFLAAAAVLRNAGIKASTVSTGLRQSILELLSPDAKTIKVLSARYAELGEDLSEQAIKNRFFSFQQTDNPLLAVLTELKRLGAGGSGEKLFRRLFDVRAENVIKVLASNLTELDSSLARLGTPGSAATAADIQMESLANSMDNLGAVTISLADTLSGNLVSGLAEGTRAFTEFLKTIDDGILQIEERSGTGVGGAIVAGLAAGATAGVKTRGSIGARAAVGVTTGLAVGGGVGGAQAAGLGGVGNAAGAVALVYTALSAAKGLYNSFKGSGIFRSASLLRKGAGVASLGRVLLGPIGVISTVVGVLLSLTDVFGDKEQTKLDAVGKRVEDAKAELEKFEALSKDLDVNQAGSYVAVNASLSRTINSFRQRLAELLGVSAERITDDILTQARKLGSGSLDVGSNQAQELIKSISSNLGISADLGGARNIADIQKLAAGTVSAENQIRARVQELLDLAVQFQGSANLSEEDQRKQAAILASIEASGGLPRTLSAMTNMLAVFAEVSANGLEADLADSKRQVEEGRRKILRGKTKKAVNEGGTALQTFGVNAANVNVSQGESGRQNLEEIASTLGGIRKGPSNAVGHARRLEAKRVDKLDANLTKAEKVIQLAIQANAEATAASSERFKTTLQENLDSINAAFSGEKGDEAQALFGSFLESYGRGGQTLTAEGLSRSDAVTENGVLAPNDFIKSLLSTIPKIIQQVSGLDKLEPTDTAGVDRRLAEVNDQIVDAKRDQHLQLISDNLINEKHALERSLLDTKRFDLEEKRSRGEGDIPALERQINGVDTEIYRLKLKQQRELEAAQDAVASQLNQDITRELNLSREHLSFALENEEAGSAEAALLRLEILQVESDLLDLGLEKLDIDNKLQNTSVEALELAQQKNKQAAAQVLLDEELRGLDEKLLDARRLTAEEALKGAKGIPLNDEEQGAFLTRRISAQENIQTNLESQIPGLSGDNLTAAENRLEDTKIALVALREEQANLTRSLHEQITAGFNFDTIAAKLGALEDNVKNLATTISDKLTEALDKVGDKFVDALQGGERFVDSLKALVEDTLRSIARSIIKAQINSATEGVLGAIGVKLPGAVKPGAKEGGDEAASIAGVTQQLSSVFKTGIASLNNVFTTLLPGLFSSLAGLLSGGGSGGGFLDTALGFVGSFFGGGGAATAATGGIITGPGTTTSDSIPLLVSNKEAILNAQATKDLGAGFIHAANAGKLRKMAQGGMTDLSGAKVSSPIDGVIQAVDNSQTNTGNTTKIINVLDPSLFTDHLTSRKGEEEVVNIMRRNPNAVKR